ARAAQPGGCVRDGAAGRTRRRQGAADRHQHGALRRQHDRHAEVSPLSSIEFLGILDMVTSTAKRAALISALIAVAFVGAPPAVRAGDPPQAGAIRVTGSDLGSRFVQLGAGKSLVIDLPRDVKDVLVSDPAI